MISPRKSQEKSNPSRIDFDFIIKSVRKISKQSNQKKSWRVFSCRLNQKYLELLGPTTNKGPVLCHPSSTSLPLLVFAQMISFHSLCEDNFVDLLIQTYFLMMDFFSFLNYRPLVKTHLLTISFGQYIQE